MGDRGVRARAVHQSQRSFTVRLPRLSAGVLEVVCASQNVSASAFLANAAMEKLEQIVPGVTAALAKGDKK